MVEYTIQIQQRKKEQFLALSKPFDLTRPLKISRLKLMKIVQNPEYKCWETSNSKGKKRFIQMPASRLMKVQRWLNNYLQSVYFEMMPDEVHGFIRCPNDSPVRRSIKTNAAVHCGKAFVINADIYNFFNAVTPDAVRNIFLKPPFNFNIDLASAIALLCLNKNSLPTGAPTSPVITNFILLETDQKLKELANKYEYAYTRYADDLTFSGENRPTENFRTELEQILQEAGFQLNDRKYRVQSKFGCQKVTGLVVNEKLNVNRKYRKQVRAMLYDINNCGIEMAAIRHFKHLPITEKKQQWFYLSVMAKVRFIEDVRKEHP